MIKENNQNKLKQIIDNLLLINLFTVIFFAIFFIFAIIMQLNGKFIFINFIQKVWNPLIVPLITILIIGALVNGINSWWRSKLLSQEEDI
jgi:ABC-type enterochelin transport system permease subunit